MRKILTSPSLKDLSRRQYGWISAGYFLTLASMPGQTLFIAQFNSSIRESFSLSHSEFSLLFMGVTLLSSLCLIWAGGLVDKVGPRLLSMICIIALAITAMAMSRADNIILLGIAMFGLRFFGQGMMPQIAMTTLSRWFTRFRGRALSLAEMGMPTGEAVLPYLLTISILAFGWRQVWVGVSIIMVLIFLPMIAFLLRNPPQISSNQKKPELSTRDLTGDFSETPMTGKGWTRRTVLRDPLFYLTIPAIVTPGAIGTMFIFHQAYLTQSKGWDISLFTALFPIHALGIIAGAIGAGAMIDRVGAWRVLPYALAPLGLGLLILALSNSIWVISIFFITFGLSAGMIAPIAGALWVEIYGTANLGKLRALAIATIVFASAAGPGFSGILIDNNFNLDQQAFIYALFCFVVVAAHFMTRNSFRKRAEIISNEAGL